MHYLIQVAPPNSDSTQSLRPSGIDRMTFRKHSIPILLTDRPARPRVPSIALLTRAFYAAGSLEAILGKKISRSFFEATEVLFVGYSRKQEAFCKAVYDAYAKRGSKVYPVNPRPESFSVTVYANIAAVPGRPEFAYVLTRKSVTAGLIDTLAERGIKRALFQSKLSVDSAALARCAELGIETAVACPMMALGGGFHKFHGFLAGVRA